MTDTSLLKTCVISADAWDVSTAAERLRNLVHTCVVESRTVHRSASGAQSSASPLPGPSDLDSFRERARLGDQGQTALAVASIENLPAIEAEFGVGIAKQLTAAVCACLEPIVREEDMAAPIADGRIGLIVTELPDDDAVLETIINRLTDRMATPVEFSGCQVFAEVRIGVATATPTSRTHDLLTRAQQALDWARATNAAYSLAAPHTSDT